ncbi:hypothetical protein F4823DRAFT_483522 [Ustulina deusta]|nr:hypothetical protein F4823DRAFT_483522 [Ustulina deusta]
MEHLQVPRHSSRVLLRPEPHHQKTYEKRRNGPEPGFWPDFRNFYPLARNWGHLRLSTIESSLLPSQKAILAMSRAQCLAYLRSSSADGVRGMSILDRTGTKDGDGDGTCTRIAKDNKDPAGNTGPADKLSVGVCIFRLDKETLRPAALLLRRSPRWWRRRVFTSAAGRQAAGEWELPGGKVEDDDFCISAAIERLVREKIGLRVTKIMVMLSGMRWRAELKVLLWKEDGADATCQDSTEEDADEDDQTRVESRGDSGVNMDWRNTSMSMATSTAPAGKGAAGESTGTEGGKRKSEEQDALGSSDAREIDIRGDRMPSSSLSSSSSPVPLTPDSASILPSPPPPPSPPKDDDNDDDDDDGDDEYSNEDAYEYAYAYDHDHEHDPSLEPAPLSLPPRTTTAARGEGEKTLRRHNTASSATLPTSLLSPYGDAGCGASDRGEKRRDAQVIPYRIVSKEYAQLNFGVVVDEDGSGNGSGLPGFLAGGYGGGRKKMGERGGEGGGEGEGEGEGEAEEVYEHDGLEWATCARVEKLPMSEDLRQVVFEGLAWMGELTGRFF